MAKTARVPAPVAGGASATEASTGVPRAIMAKESSSMEATEVYGAPAVAALATTTAEDAAAGGKLGVGGCAATLVV